MWCISGVRLSTYVGIYNNAGVDGVLEPLSLARVECFDGNRNLSRTRLSSNNASVDCGGSWPKVFEWYSHESVRNVFNL